jgi:hypothetical protein
MNTALGTKKAGMVLLNTTSFSGVSSTSLAADTFTSTYRNYKVIFVVNSVSVQNSFSIRLRAAGSDISSANYDSQYVTGASNSPFASFTDNGTSFTVFGTARDTAMYTIVDFIQPKETAQTFVSGISYITDSGANQQCNVHTGRFQLTTSFDSASFITNTGTFTGNYSVYGYSI